MHARTSIRRRQFPRSAARPVIDRLARFGAGPAYAQARLLAIQTGASGLRRARAERAK
jgi:hypothetical protein